MEFLQIQHASVSFQFSSVTVSGEILLVSVNSHSMFEKVSSLQTQARVYSSWSASVRSCWDSYIVIFSRKKYIIFF